MRLQITYPDASTNEFKYYGDGKRYEKIDSDGTKRYVYNGVNTLMEYDINGSTTARYTMALGIDEPISVVAAEQSSAFYHTDGLGSVREITSSTGAVLNTYSYDAWGNQTSSSETVAQPFTYTAREWDSDSGLYYYRARYMDASVGRFTTMDPALGNADNLTSFHGYGYVANNPVRWRDPGGKDRLCFENCVSDKDSCLEDCQQYYCEEDILTCEGYCWEDFCYCLYDCYQDFTVKFSGPMAGEDGLSGPDIGPLGDCSEFSSGW